MSGAICNGKCICDFTLNKDFESGRFDIKDVIIRYKKKGEQESPFRETRIIAMRFLEEQYFDFCPYCGQKLRK